jgi:transposase
MAAKPIHMDQIRKLLQQKSKDISIRTIALNTGFSHNTVRHYLRAVDQHGYSPQQAISLEDEQLSRLCHTTEPAAAGGPRLQDLLGWITIHGNDLRKKNVTRQLLWEEYRQRYPSMIKCFNDDLPACLVHLKYPYGHRRSIHTTNLIERSFVEQKRRTKIIPNHVNEKGAMKLVYGTLIRAARRWQRVTMDPADLVLLKTLRQTMCNNQNITLNDNRISFNLAA